jgi:hypothetical protein
MKFCSHETLLDLSRRCFVQIFNKVLLDKDGEDSV